MLILVFIVNRNLQVLATLPKSAWLSLLLLVGLILVRTFFFSVSTVQGRSMIPTLNEGDLVLINKWSGSYQPGDVIVFEDSRFKAKIVKRLVATESSEVYVDNFKLYVNRQPYHESLVQPPVWDFESFDCRFSNVFRVQDSEFFVMGDNRCQSRDSRLWGPIKQSNVIGKVAFTLIPSRWNFLNKPRLP